CGSRRGFLRGRLFLVEITVGLDRARELQRGVGTDAGARILVATARPQLDVVHGHDDHARQRGDAADEGAELVVAAHHAERDRLLGVELLGRFRTGLEKLVLDAGGKRGLRDVDDQVGHLGTAGQLAQHLLQLLFHLRQLELQRLEVRGASLLGLEFGAQVGLGALQAFELVALFTGEHPPRQAEDQQADDRAETDLVLARPGTDVVEIKFLERHLALAHDAAPSSAAGTASSASTGASTAGSALAAGAASAAPAASGDASGAVPAGAAASAESTGGTGSGIRAPSSSFGALGLASSTARVKA